VFLARVHCACDDGCREKIVVASSTLSDRGYAFSPSGDDRALFVDFACHEQRLVIEVDGGQHAETSCAALDEKRTSFLEMHGYRVLRFWNNEVISNTEGVMTVIAAALRESATAAPPPLTPPHNAKTRWGSGTERP
jgi:Protein of unknown function (DUF559)